MGRAKSYTEVSGPRYAQTVHREISLEEMQKAEQLVQARKNRYRIKLEGQPTGLDTKLEAPTEDSPTKASNLR